MGGAHGGMVEIDEHEIGAVVRNARGDPACTRAR
jgi:hypothetical protein